MFSSLMPQRREFFDLLIAHSDRLVASANAVLRLVNAVGDDDRAATELLVREVDNNEKSGDKIKRDVIALLHKSFITPLNRDEIHNLTLEIDKVLGTLCNVADAISMYNIQISTPEARELASLSADACMRLNRAVIALSDAKRNKEAIALCLEIEEIENKADMVLKQAITRLFQDDGDIWHAVKMREFYFLLETVLDDCQEVARTIEEILIENS